MIWTKSKINYAFVFEYDTRHTLEWRQLLEVRWRHCIVSFLFVEIVLILIIL